MNDLDQLKELLFGAEKEALDSIAERIDRRDVRTVDVADILPEAIHQSYKKDGELVESLTEPVGECLQKAFQDDPETYGDALYPVMGPAIRKSIANTLRTFTEQINTAVEHSLSPKGIKWRLQASRAGVPFGEFILQKTMLYRVEQAYLISRENGLLVDHVHHAASKIKDSDAVSAMFTAIQDFVKESFSPDRTGRLESADMGEFTLWAVHGPHALLVCVIRGTPPRGLRADLSAILERIHFRYGEAIKEYKGDTSSVPDVEVELERCLQFEAHDKESDEKKSPPVAMIALLLLAVAAAAFLAFRSWSHSNQLKQLSTELEATPGIYVTNLSRDGGDFTIRGLRDPLAIDVAEVTERLKIPADRVEISMQPFQSLQPEMIAVRAAQMFGQPDSVQFAVADTTLLVSGDAPWAWQQQLRSRFSNLAGVDSLDVSGLAASDRADFMERVAGLDERKFFFRGGVEFVDGNEAELRSHAATLKTLLDDAARFEYALSVTVEGSTDTSGDPAVNESLAGRRAALALSILSQIGVQASVVSQLETTVVDGQSGEYVSMRFVQVSLQTTPSSNKP